MASILTTKELRNTPVDELRKEAVEKGKGIAKMKLALQMQSFKDSALFRREKRQLARMLTIIAEKNGVAAPELKKAAKSPKVSRPSKATRSSSKK